MANKLYPLSYIAQQIEDFAQEWLLSTINGGGKGKKDAEGSTNEPQKVKLALRSASSL